MKERLFRLKLLIAKMIKRSILILLMRWQGLFGTKVTLSVIKGCPFGNPRQKLEQCDSTKWL